MQFSIQDAGKGVVVHLDRDPAPFLAEFPAAEAVEGGGFRLKRKDSRDRALRWAVRHREATRERTPVMPDDGSEAIRSAFVARVDDRLYLTVKFDRELTGFLRGIPKAFWRPELKAWEMPTAALRRLELDADRLEALAERALAGLRERNANGFYNGKLPEAVARRYPPRFTQAEIDTARGTFDAAWRLLGGSEPSPGRPLGRCVANGPTMSNGAFRAGRAGWYFVDGNTLEVTEAAGPFAARLRKAVAALPEGLVDDLLDAMPKLGGESRSPGLGAEWESDLDRAVIAEVHASLAANQDLDHDADLGEPLEDASLTAMRGWFRPTRYFVVRGTEVVERIEPQPTFPTFRSARVASDVAEAFAAALARTGSTG